MYFCHESTGPFFFLSSGKVNSSEFSSSFLLAVKGQIAQMNLMPPLQGQVNCHPQLVIECQLLMGPPLARTNAR